MPTLRLVRLLLSVALTLPLLAACGSGSGGMDGSVDGAVEGDAAAEPDMGSAGQECGPTVGECEFGVRGSCGAGMACVLVGSSMDGWETACTNEGAGGLGAPCASGGANQCQDTLSCDRGACRAYCCVDSPEDCQPGEFCLGIGNADGAGQCRTASDCDPIDQSGGCLNDDPTAGCYVLGAGTDCLEPGDAIEGEACEFSNSCAPGLICVGGAGAGTCRTLCRTQDPEPRCAGDFTCAGIEGQTEYGFCNPN
ncbi:MAG: hypothetical protein ACFCGT_23055 [Sandaracinaceae bacterium]